MANSLKTHIENLLKTDERLIDENNEIRGSLIRELANKLDEKLIELLLTDEKARNTFFLRIKDVFVFKHNDFKFFLDENKIDNSYTQYENRIGLAVGSKMLNENQDVVLNFPYKDCVLEGGQSTEEGMDTYFEFNKEKDEYEEKQAKRKEIFFNEVLARDEIDRLFEPKAFTNIRKYNTQGEEIPTEFVRDENGVIKDNLIIKGNNLLALHSLKKEFKGQVKLIYIDPPYNTGSDSFNYNDSFNHSSWLTFMRNRLEVARELLKEDGVMLVQCDHHEMGYINILLDDIFGLENKIQQIAIKVASASGFKAVNPGPIDVLENILYYSKNKKSVQFKKNYVVTGYHQNYNQFLDNTSPNIDDWKLIPLKEKVITSNGFKNEKEMKTRFGDNYNIALQQLIENFAFDNSENVVSVRDLHKPTQTVQELQEKSKTIRNKFFVYDKQDGEKTYIINGGALAFYSTKKRQIDGKLQVTELLTNFWNHISWAGIANEGGVKLKNGKKPEKLIKQIVELNTDEHDIVLDYHLGSGTTAAVAHKMKRQYIGIEQLDYGQNDSVVRLNNVINGDTTGISKAVNWKSGGSFVYLELAKNNEQAKELILVCESYHELISLFDVLYEEFFLHYNVRIKDFKEKISKEENFINLPLLKQKEMFCKMLDLNQMYVNASEMEDSRYKLSATDISLTKDFYQIKD